VKIKEKMHDYDDDDDLRVDEDLLPSVTREEREIVPSGEFDTDFDIIDLDKKIRRLLKNRSVSKFKREVNSIDERLATKLKKIDRKILLQEKKQLLDTIHKIESQEDYNTYVSLATPLIEEYRLYKNIPPIAFNKEDQYVIDERINVIKKFLDIAKKYIKINIRQIVDRNTSSITCMDCDNTLTLPVDDDKVVCDVCFCITYVSSVQISRDTSTKSVSSDDSLDTFKTILKKFQCLQSDSEKPKEEVYVKLDKYFKSINRMTGEEVRKLPLVKNRRGNYTIEMLITALKKIGESKHYEDVHYIAYEYWGWVPAQITEYEDTIIDHYIKTQKVYNEIDKAEKGGRTSNLGTQFRLFKHLQLVSYECSKEDFKIPTETQSVVNHMKLWKKMCENAGDPNIRYIP